VTEIVHYEPWQGTVLVPKSSRAETWIWERDGPRSFLKRDFDEVIFLIRSR
jgi:hypothetical protein